MSGKAATYEEPAVLHQYLLFHYGSAADQFAYPFGAMDGLDFPRRCVELGVNVGALCGPSRALDLGCAVGGATFQLARHCEEVIGIDASHAFIGAAKRLLRDGRHPLVRADEGSATTELEVALDPGIDTARVAFEVGDAQALRSDLGRFDVVLACNLICRLPAPMKLLRRLPDLVRPGGQLFITTPFTWLEEYTPPGHWLGKGHTDSFAGLRAALAPDFRLTKQFDLPFLIREHARKFQYGVAQATGWMRT